jgi:hypothetical protein
VYFCEADNADAWGLAAPDGPQEYEKLLKDTEVTLINFNS